MPIIVGGFGIGVISVVLPLCAVADVGPREIGPVSAITLMVQNLGGPLVLVVIQAVQTSRTLYLGEDHPTPGVCARPRLHLLAAVDRRRRCPGGHQRVLDRILRPRRSPPRSTPARPSRPASCRPALRLVGCDHPHVRAVPAHVARGPRRRRGGQPQAADPRGLHPARSGRGCTRWLPLGLRVLRKIERIVREEMNAIGGQEILFPALLPRAPYETTNRWTEYGDGVFRLKDRRAPTTCSAPRTRSCSR